jgi:hypothetical protein
MPYVGKKPADIIATAVDTTTGTFSGDLTVDTNTLYVDSANNRVGVGTVSPQRTLHLNESTSGSNYLHITNSTTGTTSTDGLIFGIDGSEQGYIWHYEAKNFILGTNNTEAMRIDSSGRLMIGTTTEGNTGADDLTIATTSNTGITIRSGTINNGGIYFSDGTSGADEYRGYVDYDHNGNNLNFATDAVERMRIDSSGNFLVGKTVTTFGTAGIALRADDSAYFTRDGNTPIYINRLSSDGDIVEFYKDGTTVGSIGTKGGDTYILTGNTGIRFYDGGTAIIPVTTNGESSDGSRDLGYSSIRFKDLYLSGDITFGDSHFIGDSGADNLLIQSSGAENIEYNSGNGAHLFHKNGSEMARIASDGHIFVGRTSLLTDFGDGRTSLVLQGTGSQDYATIQIGNNGTASDTQILGILAFYDGVNNNARVQAVRNNATDSADLLFHTRANGGSLTERMRIQANGRITVNTTDSDGHMHVFGNYSDGYAGVFHNDGNNSNRKGILVKSGYDSAGGTNKAIDIADGNGTLQGQITFSNGTVVYGAFTAFHPCIIPNADNDPNSETNAYPYGTLLEITSIIYTQKDGVNTERGIRYNVQKSSSAKSKAVLGAYGSSMNDEDNDNMHQALVLGDGHILCNNENGNIAVGDYICTSSVSGEGMKATSICTTIGIAREAITFTDSTAVLVAVEYGYRQFVPEDLEARIVALENA